ncbi:MAG: hypothetical protein FJ216_09680 [Ignavibacteria bacterium]|nr:hypothetical protein [Ignavibacteria bacterium]
MNKTLKNTKHFIIIILLFSAFSCGKTQTNPDNILNNEIKFTLNITDKNDEPNAKIKPGEYVMNVQGIYVMRGIYSGININCLYTIDEEKDIKLNMLMKLISVEKFKIYNGGKDSIVLNIPQLPFELTEKDFGNIYIERINQNITADISLEKLTRTSHNSLNADYVHFKAFRLLFNVFEINGNKITIDLSFNGETSTSDKKYTGADYTITGELKVKDFELGSMFVD